MDQHGWNQGNQITWTVDAAELWFGGMSTRKARRGSDELNWFFTDCGHAAQNSHVDLSRVLAWRAITAAPHTAATQPDTAAD